MTILLAYTANAAADAALSFALQEAIAHSCALVVVNSSKGAALGDPHLASSEQLATVRKIAEDAGVKVELEQPIRGRDVEEEVLEAAERHEARMIVIGTRRRSAMGKFILGSTAQRILMEAEVPVVAVKPPLS